MLINYIFVGQQVCKKAHTHGHVLQYYIYSDRFFVHCTALTKPVKNCKRSSSFNNKLLLNFTSALRSALSHTEICQQLDFIVIIARRLILIVGNIFTGISQRIRYRPSLAASCFFFFWYLSLKRFRSN